MVPTPSQDCGPQQITIPTVQCEDITEERYQHNKDQENKKFELNGCNQTIKPRISVYFLA